ncbi:hypothetical protein J4N45_13255 [Vibrio sp. SCSIO 43140]|uniref:hypothetical protein n=1 Tax=Vibrio sp. SCSIO 43140 TaxID=2819100 RepID=UPI0020750C23|nr:hypothetical protein [Vibrio sp. SCSIO 43140]USD59483.1 hypothetical protein J4N45_13255 [Vibrio sp. SCSIO 43140]
MLNRYSIAAVALMLIVIASYVIQFYFNLGYGLSESTADWVRFSDFVGGLIGPILSFISLILLIHSLTLQNEANIELRAEVKRNQHSEKLRSFETYFFSLIEAQKSSFSNFHLNFPPNLGNCSLQGINAVNKLGELITDARNSNGSKSDINELIVLIDQEERIYNAVRIFCNTVKMITERLSDSNGFSLSARKTHYRTLVTFTEFYQLHLIVISMQFLDCPQTQDLKSNCEFMSVFDEVGLKRDLY